MDDELDVEQLYEACKAFPVVGKLLNHNLHMSTSAVGRELRDKLILFDANHTKAMAILAETVRALEIRTEQAVGRLHKRVRELETAKPEAAGNSDTAEKTA